MLWQDVNKPEVRVYRSRVHAKYHERLLAMKDAHAMVGGIFFGVTNNAELLGKPSCHDTSV